MDFRRIMFVYGLDNIAVAGCRDNFNRKQTNGVWHKNGLPIKCKKNMLKKDFRFDFCVNFIRLFGGQSLSNREFGSEALTKG